jgi:hypothetical protein
MTWQIRNKFNGYVNKSDKTNLPPGYLIAGSRNVISTDGDLIAHRKGYTILGAENSALTQIESSFEWISNSGDELVLRSYDDELEFLYNSTWYRLLDGWSAVDFQYAAYWHTAEAQDIILFVNGDSNIYEWSGAITTFASCTANTMTKQGTTTWGEERFLTTGTRKARVIDDAGTWWEFEYTGGEGTTALTGVTVDLTTKTISAGNVIVQSVRTNTNKPTSGLKNDLISVLDNQVYVGSLTSNQVYLSAVNDYTNWTAATTVGSPKLLTLDATLTAFVPQEEFMYMSAGKDFWYQTKQTLSSDLTTETLVVNRLKTGTDKGALQQSTVASFNNYVAFISNEPTFDFLGRVENIENPQNLPLSDNVKTDFDSYDFTNAHIKPFKNNIYIALPQSLLLIYNNSKGFWESPQILPAGRLAIIGDNLYLHSNVVPETYKLFDGYNDNGNAIEAIARFSYENYGERARKKSFSEWYSEFYISSNTDLTLKLYYEYQGADGVYTDIMKGTDDFTIMDTSGGGLGKENLGKQKLAGNAPTDDMKKYRKIKTQAEKDFYELLPEYSSNGIDQRWAILAYGPNVALSENDSFEIKD